MATAESRIKRWGNSLAVVIPKQTADQLDLKEGEEVSFNIVRKGKINGFGIFTGAKPFKRDESALDRW
jgi:hypothetical protein